MIRRIVNLQLGLLLFGFGAALMIKAQLGADPWTVFNVGAAHRFGISLSILIQLTGALFLVTSRFILHQPIGFGTICNMLLVGPWLEFFLHLIPTYHWWFIAFLQLLLGIIILGLATAIYIAANLGAGPRDGFVLGLAASLNTKVGYVRMGLELSAVALGYALGGPVGIGTIIFAISIGPIMQYFLLRAKAADNMQQD